MPLYPPVIDTFARASYGSWGAADHGWIAENQLFEVASTGTAMPTAGLVQVTKIRLPVAASVTNVILLCLTAGNTLTAGQCFANLYTGAGALIGTTADQAAAWVSTGLKTMALTGGPFACAAGNYYVAYWFNGTTGPAWARSTGAGSAAINTGFATPNLLWATADSGITTTPPPNLGAQTGINTAAWCAVS